MADTSLISQWSERQLQDALVEQLWVRGFLVHHCRPARTDQGWRTPIQGDVGFPDIMAVGRGLLLVLELKSERGRLTHAQEVWLHELEWMLAGIAIVRVVRPSDYHELLDQIDAEMGAR
ncbi:MAG: hypothetical protein ACOC9T_00155 [Myxococcota bacterium]